MNVRWVNVGTHLLVFVSGRLFSANLRRTCRVKARSVGPNPLPWCALLLLLFGTWTPAAEFVVQGTYTESSPRAKRENIYDLTMAVQECNWRIRLRGRGDLGWRDLEMGTDGSAIYELESYETLERMSAATNGPSASNNAVGSIYRGPFPLLVVAPHYVVPFYAYASSCYLNTETGGKAYPIKTTSTHFLVEPLTKASVIMERRTDGVGLPIRIVFMQAGLSSVTNGVLECSRFTNIAGLSIPLSVTYSDYASELKDPELRGRYSVEIASCSTNIGVTSFVPTPNSRTLVADFRFSPSEFHTEPVVFPVPRTTWPTEDETKQTQGYKRITAIDWRGSAEMTKKRLGQINTQRVRWVRISLTLLLVVLPLALLARRYWQKPKHS